MNVEQLIKGGYTVQGENKRHYVPLYPQRSNVGNDATMTNPTMFLVEQAALLLRPSNPLWGLKMNVNNATVAQNIVLQARDEFNSEMSKKDAEIAALKAQLKGTAAKPKKKATSTTIDIEMEAQIIDNAVTKEV